MRSSVLAAALAAAAILAPNAAAQGHADVIVDAGTTTVSAAADDGTRTAQVTLTDLRDVPLSVEPAVLDQPACAFEPSPSIEPGLRTTVTLTLDPNCDVTKGVKISLGFGAPPTAASPAIVANPASGDPRWNIVAWSFGAGLLTALGLVVLLALRIREYNHLAPPDAGTDPHARPVARRLGDGPIQDGRYRYALTTLRREWHGLRPRRVESALGEPSHWVTLHDAGLIEVSLPRVPDGTIQRRLYRQKEGTPAFRRVGEIGGRQASKFLDGWNPLQPTSALTALGTNWSLKDNWVANLTVGTTALVAVLASSSTFGDALGPSAKPALTAMAVATGIATLLVALGPVIVKAIGTDLAYTTVVGLLVAGGVTLLATIGQVVALTWEVWAASPSNAALRYGGLVLGVLVGLVVLAYGEQALWYYIKTGTLTAPKSGGTTAPETAATQPRNALL